MVTALHGGGVAGDDCRHRRSFCTILVYLHIGLVQYLVNVLGRVADTAEIGVCPGKGVGNAHGCQGLIQLRRGLDLVLRHSGGDATFLCVFYGAKKRRAGQRGQIFLRGDIIVGQQGRIAVAPAGVILDKAGGQTIVQIELFGLVHHLHCLLRAVGGGKGALTDIGGFVGRGPFGVKGQGVEKNHGAVAAEPVQDLLDPSGGVIADPAVDVRHGLGVKGRLVDLRAEVVGVGLQKFFPDGELLHIAHPDGIGADQLVTRVFPAGVKECVQFPDGKAESGLQLRKSLTVCTIGDHGHGRQNAVGRENTVFSAVVGVLQQTDGKVRCRLRGGGIHGACCHRRGSD